MGLGGSKASNRVDVLNQTMTAVLTRSIMRCTTQSVITQRINISGSGNVINGVTMRSAFKLSSSCSQDSSSIQKIRDEVETAIKQKAESESIALIGALGNSKAESEANLRNLIGKNITAETINEIVQRTNTEQGLDISGSNNIVKNITQEILVDLMFQNAQDVLSSSDLSTALKNAADQDALAKQTNPLQFVADMFKTWVDGMVSLFGGPLYLIAFIIAIVVGIFILQKLRSASSSEFEVAKNNYLQSLNE